MEVSIYPTFMTAWQPPSMLSEVQRTFSHPDQFAGTFKVAFSPQFRQGMYFDVIAVADASTALRADFVSGRMTNSLIQASAGNYAPLTMLRYQIAQLMRGLQKLKGYSFVKKDLDNLDRDGLRPFETASTVSEKMRRLVETAEHAFHRTGNGKKYPTRLEGTWHVPIPAWLAAEVLDLLSIPQILGLAFGVYPLQVNGPDPNSLRPWQGAGGINRPV